MVPARRERAYDLVVIGGGPAGWGGANAAAAFGKRVAVVERESAIGGAGLNTGTLPSKALRESALLLSGWRARKLLGIDVALNRETTILQGDVVLVATGSIPARPPGFPFEHPRVHDSNELLEMSILPSLVHIGLMAMLADADADLFNRACFNYPTLGDPAPPAATDPVPEPR
jgi:NAD(P) transhydrogenase